MQPARQVGEPNILLFRRGQWYRSMDQIPISYGGNVHVCLAPELLLLDDIHHFRATVANTSISPDRRVSILAEALRLFAGGEIYIDGVGNQSASGFAELMGQHRGLPAAVVRRWSTLLLKHLEEASQRLPKSDDPKLSIVGLPSNTFTALESCMAALLEGNALWIRPSNREPFAPARFVACLLAAGWPENRVGLYSMDRQTLVSVVKYFDKATVYGGPDVVKAFGHRPNVEICGPKRGTAIVDGSIDRSAAPKWLCEKIVSDCGRFCTSLKTIFCVDSSHQLAEELSKLLDQVRVHDASLGWWPDKREAELMAGEIHACVGPADRIMTSRPILQQINGRNYLMPTLIRVGQPNGHPLLKRELPFPYATISQITTAEVDEFMSGSSYLYNLNVNSRICPPSFSLTGF